MTLLSEFNTGLLSTSANATSCDEVHQSSLYTMIPSLVRSRMPVLTSLRHSARAVVLQASQVRNKAYIQSRNDADKQKDGCSSESTTRTPSGASTPMIRPEGPEDNLCLRDIELKVLPQPETTSGVDWDVAATGVRLWVAAKTQAEQGGNPNTLRSMHIDALRYMHMALPADLTPLEVDSLRASMSPQLVFPPTAIQELHGQRPPNALRQVVAQAICWLVAGVVLILPVLMTLLNRVLQLERQHQVTEKIIANGLDMTSTLGERGVALHKALLRFKAGRMGSACVDAGSWFLEGIIGGVNDGLDTVSQGRRKAI